MKVNYCKILNQRNWACFDDCVCGGGYYEKFEKASIPGWQVWVSPERHTFRVYNNGGDLLAERDLSELESTLVKNEL